MTRRDARASRIPVGTQFSPNLISLSGFVAAAVEHSGDREALLEAVWRPAVRIRRPRKEPTKRLRSLPLESAVQYGLLAEETYEATPLAHELVALGPSELFDRFARHILLNCGGLRVVEGIEQMRADGLKVTGDSLAEFLSSQGFRVTVHNTAVNTLRMWLAKAGLFPTGRARAWDVNPGAKRRLLRLDDEQIAALAGLTPAQVAFVEGLCALEPKGWVPANEIRDWAEACRGVRIGRGSLPKEVLITLRNAQCGATGGHREGGWSPPHHGCHAPPLHCERELLQ